MARIGAHRAPLLCNELNDGGELVSQEPAFVRLGPAIFSRRIPTTVVHAKRNSCSSTVSFSPDQERRNSRWPQVVHGCMGRSPHSPAALDFVHSLRGRTLFGAFRDSEKLKSRRAAFPSEIRGPPLRFYE